MLLLMPIVSDAQNNGCSKHMDNHSKSKLIIHSTYLTCCLLHHILTLEYFVYLRNVEIIKNISPSLESKPQCHNMNKSKKTFFHKAFCINISKNHNHLLFHGLITSFINHYAKLCITNFFLNGLLHFD